MLVRKMTDAPTPESPSAASPSEPPVRPEIVRTLSDGTKVKIRTPRMRACTEKNAKGKMCAGHLKRWYRISPVAVEAFGKGSELYRCERCHTIYLPNPDEKPRTATLEW